MSITRRAVLTVTGTSIAAAGCLEGGTDPGGDGETDDGETDGGATRAPGESSATVRVRSHAEHGEVLVGPDGMTLYNFDADTQGSGESSCSDDCAGTWPELSVDGDPVAGEGVTAELTAFEREDGTTQVAADGWPLYYYAGDEEPGDAAGQGVNGVWWVLRPDGTPVRNEGTEESGGDGTEESGSDDSDGGSGGGIY